MVNSCLVPSPRLRQLGFALPVIALLAVFAPYAADAAAARLVQAPALEARVAAQVNAVRRQHGLHPLRVSRALGAAARGHSRDMAARGYFDHSSANGIPFWMRIEQHYGSRGYERWEVGENILWRQAGASAAQVVHRWMGSPSHRANLLSPSWRELGLGALHVVPARGTYGGRSVTIVTLDFGIRRR